MQEVFEKIDAILKKYRKKWLEQPTTEPCKGLECKSNDCVDCLLCYLEDDINQVAEEYATDTNVGDNASEVPNESKDEEMSMISEQIQELRDVADGFTHKGICRMARRAADTIEELSAKLASANMERSTAYYNNGWIPCSERLPKEHDSIFKKFKGTNRWCNGMFEKTSNRVLVTAQYEDGTRRVFETNTADGKWREAERRGGKVIAWQPLPEPYRGE